MTWTYDADNISSSEKDQVRFLVGDTDETDMQLQDEEIDWLLTEHGDVRGAAYRAALAVSAKWGKKADKTVGRLSLQYQQKADYYRELADDLKASMRVLPLPSATGYITQRGGILLANREEENVRPDALPENEGFI